MPHVAVIGGGITGLAAAYELRRSSPAPEVTVFEADERLGGKLRTTPFAGLPAVDEGADAFLARVPYAVDLAGELGLDLVSPATGKAYVWWGGALHPIPDGLVLGVPAGVGALARSRLLTWRGKARAALEPVVPRDHPAPDDVGALVRHRFGKEVLDRLVDPLVGSINAGDARGLSLAASTPQLAEVAARSRSLLLGLRGRPTPTPGPVFLTPTEGMQAMVDRLIVAMAGGVELRPGTPVDAVEPAPNGRWRIGDVVVDGVVVAAPVYAAARLLSPVSPSAAWALTGIAYASVAIVTLAFPTGAVRRPLDGSGHLVPKPVQRHVTAVSWASSKWAHWRQPDQVLLRASVGRAGDEHALDLGDDELVAAVVDDLGRHLGLSGSPAVARVSRWPRSFPQYAAGHLERVGAIDATLRDEAPGITVAGAAYRGLGVPACIYQGRQGAIVIMQHLAR